MPRHNLPASFNFPHSGKVLSISFILFAAWFADVSLSALDHAKLGLLGVLSYFGSLNAAVPYLLDLFRIPIDTFQLFLATGLVNSRFGSAVAAMHTFALAILGTCAVSGLLVLQPRKILRFAVITAVLIAATTAGLRFYFAHVIGHEYTKGNVIKNMELMRRGVPATMNPTHVKEENTAGLSTLARIQARGRLRVGYMSDSLPYVYANSRGAMVGFDVDMAQQLAGEMGVGLELVLIDRTRIADQVNSGTCDILMSGLVLTTDRAKELLVSSTYLDEHLAFLTPDYKRGYFISRDSIRAHPGLRIGVPNVPYYIAKVREYAPGANFVILESISKPFENSLNGLDAVAITAERGSSWSLLYPQYSVVVPEPGVLTVPLIYAVAHDRGIALVFSIPGWSSKRRMGRSSNSMITGTFGKNAEKRAPRWCIARDVLHWLE